MLPLAPLLLALAAQEPAPAAPSLQRPNVLFFLADDLGVMDITPNNPDSFYETPQLERLAASGMRMTQAYAACPVCSPTRASIMTGKYPTRVGITDYISPNGGNQPEQWRRNTKLLPAPYEDRLAHDEVTLAERFREQGYATFFAGKWHLGPEGWWPEDQGFDVNKGGITRGGPYGGKRYFSPYGNPRLEDGPEGEHLPDRLARETASFVRGHVDQPWFAMLSFYSVHTPLLAREDLKQKYQAKKQQLGLTELWGQEGERAVRLVQEHAVYAGMVEAMDQAVGTVLDAVDDSGQAERTIVIFFSDNGGLSTSEGHPTSNLPFRAGKGWMYEGGIREPMLMRVPMVTRPGSVSEAVLSSVDFLPTLMELCGVQVNEELDGVSFLPALRGEAFERAPIFWHYPHYGNQGGLPSSAVRVGDWKLIRWHETKQAELFRLDVDPQEQYDLAAREPEKVTELGLLLNEWLEETGAIMPTLNDKPPAEVGGPKGLQRLSWMAGQWASEADGVTYEEAWLAPLGGVMLGVNRVAAKEETYGTEQLRIFEEDGQLIYEASPIGQAPVRFPLTSANGQRAVFENPEHDFPKRIEYWREGELLHAVVSGVDEQGETMELSWTWVRMP